MFQYAAGRRLAYVLGAELKFDISCFSKNVLRNYALGVFNVQECFAKSDEVSRLTIQRQGFLERINLKISRIPHNTPSTWIKEEYFHFNPKVLNLSDDVYLDGYWQSEKYFKDVEEIIRRDFTIKIPQAGRNKELASLINSCESVSLHIRRGDYISNPHTKQFHGICDLNYYYLCIEQVVKKVERPHFFLFSDDPEWVRENLKVPYPMVLVDHNTTEYAYEDLRLMRQCKHHIIANSTFSWWGAWLNPNPAKLVFAPRQWFSTKEQNDADLIPVNWMRV